jgi:hypothetical protein
MPLSPGEQEIARRVAFTPDERFADLAYDASAGNREELLREMSRGDLAPGAMKLLEEQHQNLPPEVTSTSAKSAPGKFDLDGARKAGYDDAEIASFLAPQFNFDLIGAQRAGYTPTEIVNHLSPPPPDHGEFMKGLIGGTIGGNPKMFGSAMKGAGTIVESDWLKEQGAALAKLGDENQADYNPAVPSIANVRTDSVGAALADFFTKYLPYQAGNSLASMAPTIASGLLGASVGGAIAGPPGAAVGGFGGTLLSGYPMNYGDIYSDAVDDKGIQQAIRDGTLTDKDVARITAIAAVPITALDSWSMGRLGSALTSPIKTAIYHRIFQEMKAGGLREGTTEGLQQIISEAVQHGLGSDKTLSEHAVAVADNAIGGMAGGVLTGGAAGAVQRTPSAATLSEAQPVRSEPNMPEMGTAMPNMGAPSTTPQYRGYINALDQAPNADVAVAAASAAVDAPIAPDEKIAAFVQAEQDAQTQRQADEEAAYRQRDERIASLNRQIEMLGRREAEQIAEGKAQAEIAATESAQADARDQVRGLVASNLQTAPDTAMARALAGAAGVNPDEAFAARGRDMLSRMEAWQAKQPVAQPVQQPAAPALSDEEIARRMTASIPENFTPAAPLPAATPAVTIMGATPDKLTTPELRISSEVAAKPEQRQAAVQELDRRAQAYKNRGMLLPEHDSLFTAIAKLGGMNKQDVVSSWGVDPADVKGLTPIFGKPLLRTNGGLSIDGMAELLVQHGYLDQRDLQEFERKFDQELRGKPVLTPQGMERQAAATAEATASDQAAEVRTATLELTPEDLKASGYDKLSVPEQEQAQAIIDGLVEYARGKPYEALIDEIIERAIQQTEGRPYKEYAHAVIAQIKEVIKNAESANNQSAQAVSGASSQSNEGAGAAAHPEGRVAAEPARQVAGAELALTGQTVAEVKASGAAAQREAAAKKQREVAPPPEEFTLAGSNRQADQATAHGQQELAPVTSNLPAERQQLFVEYGNQRAEVSSLEEASKKWGQFRQTVATEHGVGASAIGSGARIVDQNGKEVGRISYNGKVWPPGEWHSGMKPLVGENFKPSTPKILGATPSNAQNNRQIAGERQNVGTSSEMATERPYRDTQTKALQHLARETEDDAVLKAVEDELNLRAEEHARAREERLAKGRAAKEQPAKEPAKMSEALRVKPHEPENMSDVIAAAEAAVKPASEMSAAEHLRAAADKIEKPSPVVKVYQSVEGTEIHVIKNDRGYAVSMKDTDSGKHLPQLRMFTGDDALAKATEYAESIQEKANPPAANGEEITDFGEKIGGARKDTAQATGKSTKVETEESAEPGWRKRFKVYEIASSMRPEEKGRWAIQDTRVKGWRGQIVGRETYATKEAAEKSLPLIAVAQKHRVHMGRPNAEGVSKYTIWREVTDRKRVQVVPQEFDSREDAMRYMATHAAEIIEKKTAYGEEILARPETVKRIGEARRTGPATKEMFADTFGFRGVEFGNWNNQDERQEVMNHAYDGLLDLAALLGVPPKAISLNGELALAFGARGQGLSGAKAHYEMDYGVINLTKMSGAGSLAHEWFHALDHYLARQDTKAKSEKVANERGDMVYPDTTDTLGFASHGFRAVDSKVREELRKAYTDLIQTMFTKAEQYVEDTQKAEKFVGESRESLAKALAEIRLNLTRGPAELTYMKRNNKPASAEQLAAFDQLAEKLVSGQDVSTAYRQSPESAGKKIGSHGWMAGRHTNDTLEAMSAIYKAVRGRSGFNAEGHGTFDSLRGYITRYSQRINMLKSATSGEEKTKRVPTSYAMENKKIDQGRASDYWTTEHEMAARAFSAFVEDKIAEQGNRSDFLSYGADNNLPWYRIFNVRPFPEGKERIDINKAFDKFVGELKTLETEKGTALFSRNKNQRTIPTQPDETYRAQTQALEAALKDGGYDFKVTPVSLSERVAGRSSEGQHDEGSGRRDSFALASRISGVFGKEVIPVTLDGDWNADGVVLPGSPLSQYVFLDVRSDRPAHVVLGHELSHHMEKDAPAVYKDLVQALRPMLDAEGYREARSTIGPSEDYIVKEMIGDLLGNNFGDQKFWAEVAKRSTAFGKIAGTIRQWLASLVAKLKGMAGFQVEQFVSDVEGARKVLAAATVDYLRNRGNGVGGYEAKFARAPVINGSTTGDFRDNYARGASDWVKNLLHSDARVGWWAKSVGTQQHKALTLPEFRPVYDEGQAFLSDISKYANGSADLALDLLPRIEGFKDFFKKTPHKADIEKVTDALYAGTLFGGGSPLDGRVWTDAELKQGRAVDRNGVSMQAFKPMNDNQVGLYREALAATSKSLDELGKSLVHRIVRQHGIGFDREMSLEDVVAVVNDKIENNLADLGAELENLTDADKIKDEAADIAETNDNGRPGAGARAADEYRRQTKQEAERVQAEIDELESLKKQVADIAAKTKGLQDHGYFPAMRFGKYAVHVVDPTTEKQLFFGLFESQTKANLAAGELKKQYPEAAITRAIMSQEQHRLFQGLSIDALETFADYITGENGEPIAKDPLVQGFLKAAMAERSVLKRHIHRKGIAGYSEDMPRVLASFTTAAARHTAMNYHGAEMGKLAQDIKSGDVKDEAIKLVRYLQDPQEEAQGIRGFLFMQFLGGSIANGLVNMTQPFMVTGPYLTQTTSASDAAIQLMKAAAVKPEKLTGAEAQAYQRAHREGVVSPQEIHQLRAQTGGLPLAKNLALRKLSYLWGSIYSLTEQFNRTTTFIAAYRIAEKKGLDNPYAFAKKAVEETQFVYNKGNRPNWARGPVGATVFTFKQFSISYLELMKRLYDKDKKAFALMALMLIAAAGIEGLPFAEDIEDMVDTVGQWMGYATNSKKKVRQWAMNILGPDFSQIALRGVSGLPWMPVDVSARMGMSNLIPGTAMLKQSEKNKARDVIELAGPIGQFIPTEDTMLGRALERLGKGDIMGAVKAGAPRAIQAAAKGAEQLQTGQARDIKGKKITTVTPGEAVLQMAGLNPAGVARESQRIGIVQQDIDLHNRMKSEIAEQWARGVADKEPAEVRAAREKLARWNADNPELRIAVNSQSIQQRLKEMRMTREERFVKHAPKETRAGVRAALQ